MNRRSLIVFSIAFTLLLSGCSFGKSKSSSDLVSVTPPSIVGCYVAKLKDDIFTLKISSQDGLKVSANLAFKNAYKDSSTGSFEGTFDGTILTGIYTFTSEGSVSRSELFFKKLKEGFQQGFGPAEMKGDLSTFIRPLSITWNDSYLFTKSTECSA